MDQSPAAGPSVAERDDRPGEHPGARVRAGPAADRQQAAAHQRAGALAHGAVDDELAAGHPAASLGRGGPGAVPRVAPDLDRAAGHAEADLVPDRALDGHAALGQAGAQPCGAAEVTDEADAAVRRRR